LHLREKESAYELVYMCMCYDLRVNIIFCIYAVFNG
jgi:hypothetical protein